MLQKYQIRTNSKEILEVAIEKDEATAINLINK
jgi:hypothetical protein